MIKIWEFIQTQILGMKWLNVLVGDILVKFGMDRDWRSSILFL